MKRTEKILETLIFASRWIQAPIYLGLVVGSLIYAYKFLSELLHMCLFITELSESDVLLGILTLVEFTMVANLLAMVIIGGYATFVSRLDEVEKHADKPEWLQKVDAGTLKVKLA